MRPGRIAIALSCALGVAGVAWGATPSCTDGLPAPKHVRRVTSWADFASRVGAAEPGDHVVLADGTYTLTEPLRIAKSGTAAAPIVVSAETVSGASLTGLGGFHIVGSSHLVVCGFAFGQAPWDATKLPLDVRGVPGNEDEIVHAAGVVLESSHHVRISRNTFKLDDKTPNSFWLIVSGRGSGFNRIDHNHFEEKRSQNSFLAIYGPGDGMSQKDTVDHNYFFRHLYHLEGGEAVRHGNGGRAPWTSDSVYEYNLFEECNGDPEALSIKASGSVFRYNTVRRSHGGIVLRHGNKNVVSGNFILDNEGGIRIYGDLHVVTDNYIAGNVGVGGQASIVLLSGGGEDDTGSGQCQNRPDGVRITNNTLVGNITHIDIGGPLPLPPRNCRIDNNIVVGDTGVIFRTLRLPEGPPGWEGNVFWGRATTGDTSVGYERRDPKLTQDANGVMRPPAGEKAGAHSPGGALGRPLLPQDVGPEAP